MTDKDRRQNRKVEGPGRLFCLWYVQLEVDGTMIALFDIWIDFRL